MKYLITGTGRCGTGYVAKVLTSAGVNCTHEQVFGLKGWEHGAHAIALRRANLWWGWQAESSWLAAPFLGHLEGITIVHLVRHPRDVIRSHLRMLNWMDLQYGDYQAFALEHLPTLLEYDAPAQKSAHFYLGWNGLIEPYADVFHRVEDDVRMLLDRLGIDYGGKELFGDTKYNTRRVVETDFEISDLPLELRQSVEEMAYRYGY